MSKLKSPQKGAIKRLRAAWKKVLNREPSKELIDCLKKNAPAKENE